MSEIDLFFSSALPVQISYLYPLIFVLFVIVGLFISSLAWCWKMVFGSLPKNSHLKLSNESTQDYTTASSASKVLGFWVQVFLSVERAITRHATDESQRLRSEIARLQENRAQLAAAHAKTAQQCDALTTERELLGAQLRTAQARLVKANTLREGLEQKCSQLEASFRAVESEAKDAYLNARASETFFARLDGPQAFTSAMEARDKEVERLRMLLAPAAIELRKRR